MSSNWYERNVLPWLIDFACGMKSVGKQRMKVIPQAQGRVLEIGIGTGLNLPFYDAGRVSELVGVEPSLRMHHLALRRSRAARLPVEIVGITAERLPLADAAFDTVVSTYTLCHDSRSGGGTARGAARAGAGRPAAVLRTRPRARRERAEVAVAAAAVLEQGGGRLHARPRHPGHPQGSGLRSAGAVDVHPRAEDSVLPLLGGSGGGVTRPRQSNDQV